MARKKIVFVIVEGPSDDQALAVILSKIYDVREVHVEILHYDITTERNVTQMNIVKKIGEKIKEFAVRRHFKASDFDRIIHLVDTDGAFVPDDAILEDPQANGFVYSTEFIQANQCQAVIERNRQKKGNLDRLIRTQSIWNIPYNVFYMSCNLEHVLFDKINCTDEEKEDLSYRFAKRYKDDIPGFLSFISESDFSVGDGYLSSWEFIAKGKNSLQRYTNFGLCFNPVSAPNK